jgi:hypothetical protein
MFHVSSETETERAENGAAVKGTIINNRAIRNTVEESEKVRIQLSIIAAFYLVALEAHAAWKRT